MTPKMTVKSINCNSSSFQFGVTFLPDNVHKHLVNRNAILMSLGCKFDNNFYCFFVCFSIFSFKCRCRFII